MNRHYLWVAEERLAVVGTATRAERLRPSSTELVVMPTLLKTKDGRVDLVADRQALEVLAEVIETHPASNTHQTFIA